MSNHQNPGSQAAGRREGRPRLTVASTDDFGAALATAERLFESLESVIRGKEKEIRLVICALACEGHVLFEDVPGTAKTVLSRAVAASIEGAVPSRIQCTPDLQPADVTGLSVFNQKEREFEFRPGPIFANVVLLDEINRATPKTQAAVLEAMAEGQVTVDGVSRELPDPFLLLATENPIEHEGTFVLPEAELDRFFLRTSLGYPDESDELEIVLDQRHGHPLDGLEPTVSIQGIKQLQRAVEDVYIDPLLQRWIVDLVRATRELEIVQLGASVRGSLALERASRAHALLAGRAYVEPDDVEGMFLPTITHRVIFAHSYVAETRQVSRRHALERFLILCLERAPRPGSR